MEEGRGRAAVWVGDPRAQYRRQWRKKEEKKRVTAAVAVCSTRPGIALAAEP